MDQIIHYDLTPFVADVNYVIRINERAAKSNKKVNIHLKIDTGMGRIGVIPEEASALAEKIVSLPNLELEGVCTHFPVSDSPDSDDILFTEKQIEIFTHTVDAIREKGIDPGILHTANSGAIIAHPSAHFDMVRPGICLYGYYPDQRMDKTIADFKPVMEFISRPSFIKKVKKGTSISYGRTWSAPKDTWIASVPAGYADGYNRLLSSKAEVEINGKRYPLSGRVCMDQFMIDLGEETEITTEDTIVLFGPGKESPDAAEISGLTGTIPYEVTCAVNKRVPRDYRDC